MAESFSSGHAIHKAAIFIGGVVAAILVLVVLICTCLSLCRGRRGSREGPADGKVAERPPASEPKAVITPTYESDTRASALGDTWTGLNPGTAVADPNPWRVVAQQYGRSGGAWCHAHVSGLLPPQAMTGRRADDCNEGMV